MASVFLVDDHPDVREVVGQLLQMHGHKVQYLTSGEMALKELEVSCPQVVIADHRLPQMSGVELLKSIRKDPRFQHVRCILFSADHNTRELAEEADAHHFWLKGSDTLFDSIADLESDLDGSKT